MTRIFFIHLICFSANAIAQNKKIIPFGKNHQIIYSLDSGFYSIQSKDQTLMHHVQALSGSFTERVVHDEFGRGKEFIVVAGNGHQFIIHTYPHINGFITQTIRKGATRAMTPLEGMFPARGEAIVVPFDNDAWIRYKRAADDFVSAEVTAFKGFVVGSLEQHIWKTGIVVRDGKLAVKAGWTDSLITRDAAQHGLVESGRSPRIAVLLEEDERKGLEVYAKLHRQAEPRYVKDWKGAKPLGWNSWGAMQTDISPEKINRVADFFADSIPAFRSKDNTVYIDLDSYWDKLNNEQLKAFADYCKSKNLKPGIYWAPFVDWGKSPRKMEGSEYNYEDVWTKANGHYHDFDGCRALDPTHPATKARIAWRIKQFKECGYEMIKIDFIGHAAIEADHFFDSKVKTGMQAFRQGMEYLTDQLSPMLVYAAISLNIATARYVHMRRIACDAFAAIKDVEYTLNSTSMGWWQQYMYDFIDADHIVFKGESAAVNRARLVSSIVTGSIILGDDFSVLTNAQAIVKSFAQNKALMEAVKDGGKYIPVKPGAYVFRSDKYLAIINTTGRSEEHTINANALELFSNKKEKVKTVSVPAGDAVIYRIF